PCKIGRCSVKLRRTTALALRSRNYDLMLNRVAALIDGPRRASARAIKALMTATCWSIGRHIVEFELSGRKRADYGEELLERFPLISPGASTAVFHAQTSTRRVNFIRPSQFNRF